MRAIAYLLITLFIAVAAAFFLHHILVEQGDPGYVIIGYGQWSLESSLFVLAVFLLLAFVLFYVALRALLQAMRLPYLMRKRLHDSRNKQSQQALIEGLLQSAEGNWEQAERNLIRHAANSGLPLINYLTAARAAQSRGAYEQRDEYLRMAHELMPEAELAIGLTRAELLLSHKQFDQALDNLAHLHKIAPSHAAVLKLMHHTYEKLGDWEGLRKLIPALNTNRVMMEAEIKLLETETNSQLLKQKAAQKDSDGLKQLWREMPHHIRALSGIQTIYFAAMINSGASADIEQELRQALQRNWDETLLMLYSCIDSKDPVQYFKAAQMWLETHGNDAVLLRVLGKLALRQEQAGLAQDYLDRSIAVSPSVEAYQLTGDLCLQQGDLQTACENYRKGLLYASSEVVAQIEERRN